jgi:dihydrolipoamide dehydrogenase
MITVIGSGPAGIYAAITASSLGEKVTLIELNERLGGTCVLYGCIPSKAMLHPLTLAYELSRIGIEVKIEYETLRKLAADAISRLSKGVEYMLESHGVNVIRGKAKLKGKDVEVNGQSVKSDKIVVATGTLKPTGGITSDDLPYLEKDFNRIVVVGGGVGGVEYGWLLRMSGKEVYVVEKESLLLPKHDKDLREAVTNQFRRIGVKLVLNSEAKVEGNKVILSDGKALEGDLILISFGRRANLEGFEELPQVEGWLKVNEYMETLYKGIYGAGDVTRSFTAHEAIHKGLIAGLNAVGIRKAYNGQVVPKVIYTMPQIAYVGNTEDGECVKVNMVSIARAIAEKETEGFVKICFKEGKIVGAVAFSERAEEIITLIALAMRLNASLEQLLDFQFPHPSYLEAIWEGVYEALRQRGK